MTFVFVAIGAAVGAPLRFFVDKLVESRTKGVFPWGTFTVNVAGSFVLGTLVTVTIDADGFALWGTGFCGAFTTYSTFSYQTLTLIDSGAMRRAIASVVLSVVAGVIAALAGMLVVLGL